MSKTILVTGSSGTVGTAVTLALEAHGYQVVPVDIKRNLWYKDIERRTVRHDLRRPLTNIRLDKRPDMVLHFAANARVHDSVLRPRLARDNFLMTFNVLEFVREREIERVLFSSSREVYGESRAGQKRKEASTHVTAINSPYTASKFSSEAMINAYRECYAIKPVIVRLSNVYGRYDVSERVIPLFTYYALRNREIQVFGRAKSLDFTYIDDCVDGIIRVVRRFDRAAGRTLNISFGRSERLSHLAGLIVEYANSSSRITFAPKRVGEIANFTGDISLATRLLGYKPKIQLQDGLPLTIEWYRQAMKDQRVYATQRRILSKRGWA